MFKIKIIFFHFLCLCLNAQFLKVEYQKINKNATFGRVNQSVEMREKVKEQSLKSEYSVLYYANGNSFYKTTPTGVVYNDIKEIEVDQNTKIRKREISEVKELKIYHIKGEEGNYKYEKIGNQELYQYDKLKFSSIRYIKDKTEIIEKYLCKIVEVIIPNGDLINIYYTEDIPVSSGPYGYNSFPGLVLKIESPKFVIFATKISNEASEKDVEKIDKNISIFTGEEYDKKIKELTNEATKEKVETIHL